MLLSTIQQGVLRQTKSTFPKTTSHPESFTSIPLVLDPKLREDASAGPVDEKLYSGFLEHLGRCIYGGIVDNPAAPSSAELLDAQDDGTPLTKGRLGWRKDVRAVLARDGEVEVPMMRWPGGNYVSNYHWQDGIGPVDQRPTRVELAWLAPEGESNKFGTDEFIDLCTANKWEPYICLNSACRFSICLLSGIRVS